MTKGTLVRNLYNPAVSISTPYFNYKHDLLHNSDFGSISSSVELDKMLCYEENWMQHKAFLSNT